VVCTDCAETLGPYFDSSGESSYSSDEKVGPSLQSNVNFTLTQNYEMKKTICTNINRLANFNYREFPDLYIKAKLDELYKKYQHLFFLRKDIVEDLVYYTKKILKNYETKEVTQVLTFLLDFSTNDSRYSKNEGKKGKILKKSIPQFYYENKHIIFQLRKKMIQIWIPEIPMISIFAAKLKIEDTRLKKSLIAHYIKINGFSQTYSVFLAKNKSTQAEERYTISKIKLSS
jgi:hypothetical protein